LLVEDIPTALAALVASLEVAASDVGGLSSVGAALVAAAVGAGSAPCADRAEDHHFIAAKAAPLRSKAKITSPKPLPRRWEASLRAGLESGAKGASFAWTVALSSCNSGARGAGLDGSSLLTSI
jgi:hypothetical protein